MKLLGVTLAAAAIAAAQTKSASPQFEVVSVRPSDPDDKRAATPPRVWGDDATRKVSLHHVPLNYVLMHVYDMRIDQLSGPSWLPDQFFDILATVPAGTPKEQLPLMFEALLKDRFKMQFHREAHTERVLALVVGKDGAKLKEPLPPDPNLDPDFLPRPKITGALGAEDRSVTTIMKTPFGMLTYTLSHGVNHYVYSSMTMENITQFLNQPPQVLGLPVVDKTELKGSYQVTLDTPANPTTEAPVPGEASDPTGSIQESLHKMGLDVVRRETQTEKFVIDHIEKTPTPN